MMRFEEKIPQETPKLTLEMLRKSIPEHLFHKSELRFMISLLKSLSLILFTIFLAFNLLPLTIWAIPLWIIYALICGTFATGLWVLGHECGHYAFSVQAWRNNFLGFLLHSSLLVPYFSWQHSHFVHHTRTNHLTEGEGYVPDTIESKSGKTKMKVREWIGTDAWAIKEIFSVLLLGWPAYMFFGKSGGPKRGPTSHVFVPNKLFPMNKLTKVLASDFGVLFVVYVLYLWAQKRNFIEVLALYIGPYIVVNAWLTGYTWLQHIDEDIPHYDEEGWDWLKGALSTIDRAYPEFINALHFDIGSTHVLHHLFSSVPHYHAREATRAIKKVLGVRYNFDGRDVWKAMWDVGKLGVLEKIDTGTWKHIKKYPFFEKKT